MRNPSYQLRRTTNLQCQHTTETRQCFMLNISMEMSILSNKYITEIKIIPY